MHSALLVAYYGRRVLVDCGADWRGRIADINPHAIILTHAHPDHAWGLKDGALCPVYATDVTWDAIENYPIATRRTVAPRSPVEIEGITFEAFPVDHSTRAPAVGYRITAGRVAIFYVPDVVYIPSRSAALKGVRLYIGDGATITRSMVRRVDDQLIGHVPLRTQLTWCQKEGLDAAIFTHCGAAIVNSDPDAVTDQVDALAAERGVTATVATDGMERVLR
jgi:phosphoribosyl 1,2-cyclic phosphodiesterase